MEKFINFKQLEVVLTATSTSDGSAALTLTSTGAAFTQKVLVNAIVWDRTTNAANGGQKYLVTAVTSDTVLALVAIGPTSDQGTGVPDAVDVFIYMPEFTVKQYGTTSATEAKFLVDGSGVNFVLAGVQVGDYARDIAAGTVAVVTSVSSDKLGVSNDIFLTNENYLVYREGADDFTKIVRASDIIDVSNDATTSSEIEITYNTGVAADLTQIDYAYSSTVGANSAMRNAIQESVVLANETEWSYVTLDFPGLLNPFASVTNATFLGGREFFILRIQ